MHWCGAKFKILNLNMDIKEIYEKICPKIHQVYFTDDKGGLTMTAANHITNVIKNTMLETELAFENAKAYTQTTDFKGNQLVTQNAKALNNMQQLIVLQGESFALTAWLKEAIKAKNEVLNIILRSTEDFFRISELDGEVEEFKLKTPELKKVNKPSPMTEEAVISMLTLPERVNYLKLESLASHLGKKIHPTGAIYNIRRDILSEKSVEFVEKRNGTGMESYAVQNTPVYTIPEINKVFLELTELHRSTNEQLNYLKAKIKNKVTEIDSENAKKYDIEMIEQRDRFQEEYEVYSKALRGFEQRRALYLSKIAVRRLALKNYINKLRIVVPNDLSATLADYQKK